MSDAQCIWTATEGEGPLAAVALHAGHEVRPSLAPFLGVTEAERLREEDPFTADWAAITPTRLVATHSRFQIDLNRPRERAIYRVPADAWELTVWRAPLPESERARSLADYDAFYAEAECVFARLAARHGRFLVYDLHSYNHRRAGPGVPPADPAGNPDIDIGTGSVDRALWAPVVAVLKESLRGAEIGGRRLDVRENVRFPAGGHFARWVALRFPGAGCAVSIEMKKTFMDEWTGALDLEAFAALGTALRDTTAPVAAVLARMSGA